MFMTRILSLLLIGILIPVFCWGTLAENPHQTADNQSASSQAAATEKAFTTWYTLGLKALSDGRYQAAVDAFIAALRLEPGSVQAQTGHAQALEKLGRKEDVENTSLAVGNVSIGDNAVFSRGMPLNEEGENTITRPFLKNGAEQTPGDCAGWNQLAAVYAGQGRYEEALTAVRTSLDISISQAEGWSLLGDVLCGQGRFYESIAAYEKAISLNPEYSKAYTGLGKAWGTLGRTDDAITEYQNATGSMPDSIEHRTLLAGEYEPDGKANETADTNPRADQTIGEENLSENNSSVPGSVGMQEGNISPLGQNTNTSAE